MSSHIIRPSFYLSGLLFESMRWRSDDHFDWRRWWWGPTCVLWNRYQIYWSETKRNKYDSNSKRYSQYRKERTRSRLFIKITIIPFLSLVLSFYCTALFPYLYNLNWTPLVPRKTSALTCPSAGTSYIMANTHVSVLSRLTVETNHDFNTHKF